MYRDGYGATDIARDSQVSFSRQNITIWLKQFRELKGTIPDTELVLDKVRSGRPHKYASDIEKLIVKKFKYAKGDENKKRKKSIRKVQSSLHDQDIDLSYGTLNHLAHKAGKPYKRRKLQYLSEQNIQDRLIFAKKYVRQNFSNWLFTDESDFPLYPDVIKQNIRYWTDDPSQLPTEKKHAFSPKVSVWAGITSTGRTKLYFYEGSLNAERYQSLLGKATTDIKRLLPRGVGTFQHDGASAHKAASTNVFLQKIAPKLITSGPQGEWPGNSPDLNPIENIWAIMANKLAEKPPRTLAALQTRLKKVWDDIEQEQISNTVLSVRHRLKAVIKAKGRHMDKQY
jgi:transposase